MQSQYQMELHTLRQCMTVVLGGVETGQIELAEAALKRAEGVLNGIKHNGRDRTLRVLPRGRDREL